MTKKDIEFCRYAKVKLEILAARGFKLSESDVKEIVDDPDKVLTGHKGRKIAQRAIDEQHVLRVIFEEYKEKFVVVTFYPARRQRYEDGI